MGDTLKIKRLRIKNFQSIKDLEFEFKKRGITRFTGPNNIGKSVVLKAIKAIMMNISNRNYKDYIRDNESFFEIFLEDFKGNWVKLSRGTVDFYEWNIGGNHGRVDKTKGKVPKELEKYFNLYVEKEKTKECLNIRLPREVLLFIDTSAGDNAMMIQKALGTEEYMLAIKEVNKRGRELNKEVQLIENYYEQEKKQFDEMSNKLIQKEEGLKDLERFEKVLRKSYKDYLEVDGMVDLTVDYVKTKKEVKGKKSILDSLELEGIKEGVEEISYLNETIEIFKEYTFLIKGLQEKKQEYDQIELSGLGEEVEKMEDVTEMLEILGKYEEYKTEYQNKNKEFKEVEKEFKEFKEEIGVCPLCGTDIRVNHVH